jgi:hypothetical protein
MGYVPLHRGTTARGEQGYSGESFHQCGNGKVLRLFKKTFFVWFKLNMLAR